jgi:hypothetical protein
MLFGLYHIMLRIGFESDELIYILIFEILGFFWTQKYIIIC